MIPLKTLQALGKAQEDIIATDLGITAVTSEATRALRVFPLQITVGSKTSIIAFFVINANTSYKLLLGRHWIHSNMHMPSTLHPFLLFWNGDKVKMVKVKTNPFKSEVKFMDACIYYGKIQPITFDGLNQEGKPTILNFSKNKYVMCQVA